MLISKTGLELPIHLYTKQTNRCAELFVRYVFPIFGLATQGSINSDSSPQPQSYGVERGNRVTDPKSPSKAPRLRADLKLGLHDHIHFTLLHTIMIAVPIVPSYIITTFQERHFGVQKTRRELLFFVNIQTYFKKKAEHFHKTPFPFPSPSKTVQSRSADHLHFCCS